MILEFLSRQGINFASSLSSQKLLPVTAKFLTDLKGLSLLLNCSSIFLSLLDTLFGP